MVAVVAEVADVAVVADVADVALPDNAPEKVVAITIPSEVILIFSVAVSEAPVAKTNSVGLLAASKVPSASAQMDALTRRASAPVSAGARKSTLPSISPSTTVNSFVARVK